MKCCDKPPCVPCLIATAGIVIAIVAVVGRFVSERTVFGAILPGAEGIAASSVLMCANTVLLVAIFAKLNHSGCKSDAKEEPKEEPKSE